MFIDGNVVMFNKKIYYVNESDESTTISLVLLKPAQFNISVTVSFKDITAFSKLYK